ncbi:uncharacterized protein MYCFIDRAFT_175092 [Pseudocercospora fijiensis CIRAD86]|uniref:Uncharacterized protein n=1 Tax=Pseudocercospora fijiensis (strain CIRAD86) TaxID=383855 RepID=M2Z1G0_PSEFD|nr:uncharacterized protein MYCFIDRAFT_175092 [Pseudocercospora fijiensis CIRAD86]EME83665.1 hypothetical protein MYCFIDRAFT_175092 [Pseudocercospora fijiensis CIRAD86]
MPMPDSLQRAQASSEQNQRQGSKTVTGDVQPKMHHLPADDNCRDLIWPGLLVYDVPYMLRSVEFEAARNDHGWLLILETAVRGGVSLPVLQSVSSTTGQQVTLEGIEEVKLVLSSRWRKAEIHSAPNLAHASLNLAKDFSDIAPNFPALNTALSVPFWISIIVSRTKVWANAHEQKSGLTTAFPRRYSRLSTLLRARKDTFDNNNDEGIAVPERVYARGKDLLSLHGLIWNLSLASVESRIRQASARVASPKEEVGICHSLNAASILGWIEAVGTVLTMISEKFMNARSSRGRPRVFTVGIDRPPNSTETCALGQFSLNKAYHTCNWTISKLTGILQGSSFPEKQGVLLYITLSALPKLRPHFGCTSTLPPTPANSTRPALRTLLKPAVHPNARAERMIECRDSLTSELGSLTGRQRPGDQHADLIAATCLYQRGKSWSRNLPILSKLASRFLASLLEFRVALPWSRGVQMLYKPVCQSTVLFASFSIDGPSRGVPILGGNVCKEAFVMLPTSLAR